VYACASCGWVDATSHSRVPSQRQGFSTGPLAALNGVRVLGGDGLGLLAGTKVDLTFLRTAVEISDRTLELPASIDVTLLPPGFDPSGINTHEAPEPIAVPYSEIIALEIGGPGARRSGGGFFGGGFGLAGAAEGILIASALNLLTTRTTVDTVICLQTATAELFLHDQNETPEGLRMRLSPVFNILREHASEQHGATRRREPTASEDDVADRLTKLSDMLHEGLLSRDEFDDLKRELLGDR
jgi:hypothetical protein